MATIVVGWVDELNAAIARADFVYVLENDTRIVRYWYALSATYIFGIVRQWPLRELRNSGLLN